MEIFIAPNNISIHRALARLAFLVCGDPEKPRKCGAKKRGKKTCNF
jgi:hypothetical protein